MDEAQVKAIITAEISGLKEQVQKAKDEIDKLEKKGDSGFKKFANAAKACGKAVVNGLKVIGTAIGAAITAVVGLAESTEEYRTAQAKLKTAFEASGGSAEQAAKTYNGLYRVLGDNDVAVEAANHLAQMTSNEQDLAEWTNICQGVFATFGDSLPIEGLTEAANETAKTGKVTGVLADALNWSTLTAKDAEKAFNGNKKALRAYKMALAEGATQEDAFNEALAACNNEAEREALLRSTLNHMYDEAATLYEENAAELLAANEAQAKLTAGLAALGGAVQPILTIFKSFLGDTLQKLVPSFEKVAEGLKDMINGIDGGANKIKNGISEMMNTVITTITKALPMVLKIGVDIIVALVQGIIQALPQILKAIVGLIPQLLGAITELLPQLIGAILGSIPLLVGAVAEVITGIVNGLAEMLPTIVQQLIEFLPSIIQSLIDAIPLLLEAAINFFMAIVEAIPQILPPLIEALPTIIQSILDMFLENLPVLIEGAIALFMGIVEAIPQIIPVLVEALPQIITSILLAIAEAIPLIFEGAINLFMGFVDALYEIIPQLWEGCKAIVSTLWANIVEKIGPAFGEAWDSVVDIWNGAKGWFSDRWEDIKEVYSTVSTWFSDTFSGAKTGVENSWSGIKDFFSGKWEDIKGAFANTKEWMKEKFSGAWNAVKTAWSNPKQFFTTCKTNIQNALSTVDTWMGSKFGAAWENVKAKFAGVGAFFTGIWTNIKNIFSNIGTAIGDAVKGAVSTAVNKVLSTACNIINGFIGAINTAISVINAIPGVSIRKISKLSVPAMAMGGVVDSATLAQIGEDGAEAVVPLENNLGWLDRLAEMLSERMGGGAPIYLQIDGKTFGQISVDSINQLTRQTGTLGIRMA